MIRLLVRFALPAAAFAAAGAFLVPALFPSAPSGEAMLVADPAPASLQTVEFSGDDCAEGKTLGRHTIVLLLDHGQTLTIPLASGACDVEPVEPPAI